VNRYSIPPGGGVLKKGMIDMPETHEYFIMFDKDEDPIRVSIKQDINRPNCPDDCDIISDYVQNNYGNRYYEIYPLFDEDMIIL
jgi:hypothetical protein